MPTGSATLSPPDDRPRQLTLADGRAVALRTMNRGHAASMLAFAQALPPHELLALAEDITDPDVIDDWIADIESASTLTIVAFEGESITAYASLLRGAAPWSQHRGEIRIAVEDDGSASVELGARLAGEIVVAARAAGIRKIVALMTCDAMVTRAILEQRGFSPEAILTDQVIDDADCTHDVLIMARAIDIDLAPDAEDSWPAVPVDQTIGDAECAHDASITEREIDVDAARDAAGSWLASQPAVAADRSIDDTERTHDILITQRDDDTAHDAEDLPSETPAAVLADQVIDDMERMHDAEDSWLELETLVPVEHITDDAERPQDVLIIMAQEIDVSHAPAVSTPLRDTLAPSPRLRTRVAVSRRAYLVAAVIGLMLALGFGAFYALDTGDAPRESQVLGSAQPQTAATAMATPDLAFEASLTGSGHVFLPLSRPAMTVRVSVAPDVVGTWFWCVESSFGMPLSEHICGSVWVAQPGSGELISEGVIHIDPAWPADATYYVQMYCENPCAWRVQVVGEQ